MLNTLKNKHTSILKTPKVKVLPTLKDKHEGVVSLPVKKKKVSVRRAATKVSSKNK